MEQLLSLLEAASRTGVTRQRLQQLCAQGRIAGACKIGHQWAIPVGAAIKPVKMGRPRTRKAPKARPKRKTLTRIR